MSTRNSPPLEATLLPDVKPRKSWVPFIMGSILVGSCLLAVVLGVWGLIKLIDSLDHQGSFVGMGSGNWPTAAEKQTEYRSVYKVPVAPSQDADAPQVEKLLAKYASAAKYNDQGALARLVDVDAFLKRMQEHPDMPYLDVTERKALVVQLNQSLQLPEDILDIRLMGFKRLSPGGLGVADVIFKQPKGAYEPCRIWLQQRERTWSIVDWEYIQSQRSEAGNWAGAWRASREYMVATEHRAFREDLQKGNDCYRQADIPAAVRLAQTADQRSLPDYLFNESKMHVAWLYFHCGQYQPAMDCLRSINGRDDVPGVHVIRALCHQRLGQSEPAIAAAVSYERLCGFSPDVVRAKGLALIQLQKKVEAATEFKRLLEFDPADHVALQQLVTLLPAGEKGQIADLIARSKDPPTTALAIAGSFQILEDAETSRAIQGLLEKKFPASPATHAFVARLHQHEEEFDLAAAAFRRSHAAETDADVKKQRWNDYVSAMHSAGKLVQAYEESPNPVETFAYLTEGLVEEESLVEMKDLQPLLDAHRRRMPNDPQLYYCTGLLARHQDDLAAADEAFAAGEAKATDESLKEELQYARMELLAGQGRILDAYRDYEKLDGAFRDLAEHCRRQHKPDVLEELIRVHRQSHPKDPELPLYTIALHIERNKLQKAWEGLQNNDLWEDSLIHRAIPLEVEIYARFNDLELAIRQFPPHPAIMPSLAARFENEQSWDKLRKLLDMNIFRSAKDTHILLHEMKLAWHLRDYYRIETLVSRWDAAVWEPVPKHEQRWAREMLVRSLLRQGKTSAAYAFAEQFQREFAEDFPLLLVRIAQGESGPVKALYPQVRYRAHNLEQDAELLPLLTDARYAEIRRETPLELPSGSPRTSLVLFLRQDVPLDEERLRKLLEGEDFQVKLLPATSRPGRTLAVTHASGVIFLTSGNSPYHLLPGDLELIRTSGFRGEVGGQSAVNELKTHKAWLALELIDFPAALTTSHEDRLAKKLVQKLCDENLAAIALDEPMAPTIVLPGFLLRADSFTPQRSWRETFSGGSQLWLSLGSGVAESEERKPLSRKAQREFAAAVAKLPAGQFAQVRVDLTLGHASEQIWLKVLRLERHEFGGYYQFTCELPADSELHPSRKAGEHCNVSFWQVRETRLP